MSPLVPDHYVHSDPLQRSRAYVRSISFNFEVDLEAYSDPTVRWFL